MKKYSITTNFPLWPNFFILQISSNFSTIYVQLEKYFSKKWQNKGKNHSSYLIIMNHKNNQISNCRFATWKLKRNTLGHCTTLCVIKETREKSSKESSLKRTRNGTSSSRFPIFPSLNSLTISDVELNSIAALFQWIWAHLMHTRVGCAEKKAVLQFMGRL